MLHICSLRLRLSSKTLTDPHQPILAALQRQVFVTLPFHRVIADGEVEVLPPAFLLAAPPPNPQPAPFLDLSSLVNDPNTAPLSLKFVRPHRNHPLEADSFLRLPLKIFDSSSCSKPANSDLGQFSGSG